MFQKVRLDTYKDLLNILTQIKKQQSKHGELQRTFVVIQFWQPILGELINLIVDKIQLFATVDHAMFILTDL